MLGSELRVDDTADSRAVFDPAIRDLLDHVAAELAAEYIRLMETAAKAEIRPHQPPQKSDLRRPSR